MSQHDYNLANGSGASFRSDANVVLGAIATNNSGASAPSTTFAYQWWVDTTADLLKIRNAANSAWVTVGSPSVDFLGHRTQEPINTNPNWLLDQINEGALYTSVAGAAVFGPDAWSMSSAGGAAGVFKCRRITDPDFASGKALEITCTTIDASIAAGDFYVLSTAVEGYDVADLRPGLASASKITVMFDMKFSVTGTYGVAIQNSAANRTYVGTVTQNVANTRESKAVTLTLDTTGTWIYTNGIGLQMFFCLEAGSTFQTTAGTWGAGNFFTTSAQAHFMSNVANIGYLGPVHIIPGGVALAYHKQDIDRELAKAQRQYEKSFDQGVAVGSANVSGVISFVDPTTGGRFPVAFKSKRVAPNMTGYSHATGTAGKYRDDTSGADFDISFSVIGTHGALASFATHGAIDEICSFHFVANSRLS